MKPSRWVALVAAGCLFTGFSLVGAQQSGSRGGGSASLSGPRLGETQHDPEYEGGPEFTAATKGVRAFLGGGYGSHYLNGETGRALYKLPGHDFAEEFGLVWEATTNNYYYYHEEGFDQYKWRFGRWNAGNNNFLVQHTRPEDGWRIWTTVHYALLSDLPENTTLKLEREGR